jgi:hypothetical protein
MQVDVLSVLPDSGPLATVGFDPLDPHLCGLCDRQALTRWRVRTLANIDAHCRVVEADQKPRKIQINKIQTNTTRIQ